MIVQAVSDETLNMTRKYVLMIATAAIFTYLSRAYRSLREFLSMDSKEMNKMHFVHKFDVYSTVVYCVDCNGSTPGRNDRYIIQYQLQWEKQSSYQKGLTISCKYLDIYKSH